MKESVRKRIDLIRVTDDMEVLREHLCPFFEKGGCPDCLACRKTEEELNECRAYYLERIVINPLDLWDETFDRLKVASREKVPFDKIVGIGVNCDNCYMSDKCPLFQRGYACAIEWETSRPTSPKAFIDFLINLQYERVQRASVFEKVDGGVPDANLSGEIDRLTDLIDTQGNMMRERLSINVEATGAVASSEGGGILSKLFGGSKPALEEKKPLEIPVTPKSREDIEDVTPIEEPEKIKVPRKRTREV